MWKEIYEWATQLLVLSKETERNRVDIKEVNREVERLTLVVQGLAFEIKRLGEKIDRAHENETHEREKLALKLENEILKFERRLPSAKEKRMKIRKLQLKNIGVFDDETIDFQPCPVKNKAEIHIFTGQNGSGKTTILQALVTLFCNSVVESEKKGEVSGAFELGKNQFTKKLRKFIEAVVGFEVEHLKKLRNFNFEVNLFGDFGRAWTPFDWDVNNDIDKSLNEYSASANVETKEIPLNINSLKSLEYAAFAYSGYRRIEDEPVEIGKEINENPLYQALDFVKDENSKFNVNQWLGRNLINLSLEQTKNRSDAAKKIGEKINRLEKVINDIIADEVKDDEIKFEMQSATKLVLIKNNQELDFDVLPDGLKSLISWIGDLLMRLDSLQWKDDTPIFDREIILFLDEIEVHLHPAWQRKVLPVVQKLFKNSQIFVSTHSPFVVNSVDDAWVYKLELENGKAKVADVVKSEDGISYQTVLSEIFGIDKEFGGKTQDDLDKFYSIVRNGKKIEEKELKKLAKSLAEQSEELNSIVQIELRQLSRRKGKEFSI